ncbi:hypothetical protein ABBQ32_006498 [Trebouxia sp. C0010 RCD-2024]
MNGGNPVIGYIGLGSMGLGMATNLQENLRKRGASLHVHNRTESKANTLLDQGAIWESSPAKIAKNCQITFCSMFADDGLKSTFKKWLNGGPQKGSIYVDSSTVYPGTVKELTYEAEKAGMHYVSAPVFGRPDAALEHRVLFAVAGAKDIKQQLQTYFDWMGRGTLDLGEEPYKANVMKITGNFFIVACVETIAEAMTLAEKNGIPRDTIAHFVSSTFPGPIYPGYAERLAAGDFEISPSSPGFPVTGGCKDLGLMQQLAKESNVPLPLADIIMTHEREAEQQGNGDKDWGCIVDVLRNKAGLGKR